jgi:hypothetical protein
MNLNFKASEILQASSGVFFTGDIGDVYRVLNCAYAGPPLFTHQLPDKCKAFRIAVKAIYPQLDYTQGDIGEAFKRFAHDIAGAGSTAEKENLAKGLVKKIDVLFPKGFDVREGMI